MPALLEGKNAAELNVPAWLRERWRKAYGLEVAAQIAEASLREAPLDISLKPGASPHEWAERLGGRVLPTGSIRLAAPGRIEELPGFGEGIWWVQDAAAALVARVPGDLAGKSVADLCAAPAGNAVLAGRRFIHRVDVSASAERLAPTCNAGLSADFVAADAATAPWLQFDVSFGCTGAQRRAHPRHPHLALEAREDAAHAASRRLWQRRASCAPEGTSLQHVLALTEEAIIRSRPSL